MKSAIKMILTVVFAAGALVCRSGAASSEEFDGNEAAFDLMNLAPAESEKKISLIPVPQSFAILGSEEEKLIAEEEAGEKIVAEKLKKMGIDMYADAKEDITGSKKNLVQVAGPGGGARGRLSGINPGLVNKIMALARGRSLKINSTLRSVAGNRRAGGVGGSRHLSGNAVDLEIPGVSHKALCQQAAALGMGAIYYPGHLHVQTGAAFCMSTGTEKSHRKVKGGKGGRHKKYASSKRGSGYGKYKRGSRYGSAGRRRYW